MMTRRALIASLVALLPLNGEKPAAAATATTLRRSAAWETNRWTGGTYEIVAGPGGMILMSEYGPELVRLGDTADWS